MSWLRVFVIEKLGGFVRAEDALAAITDPREKTRILTLATKRLFNTIGPDDILKVHESGTWMLEGRPLSAGERDQLIAEGAQFLGSRLWKVLQLDIKHQANRKMYVLGKSEMDLVAGKLWALTLDAFKTRLESMKGGKGNFNSNS